MKTVGSFDELLNKDTLQDIQKLFDKIKDNSEFEFIFFSDKTNDMSLENHLNILKYMTIMSKHKKQELKKTVILDINYSSKDTIYRLSISGEQNINKYLNMLYQRENHVIFNILSKTQDKSITLLKKKKDATNKVDIKEFNMRVRLSTETKLSDSDMKIIESLDNHAAPHITYRYKQRITLELGDNIQIDLTETKMTKHIARLEKTRSTYELELEYMNNKSKKNVLDIMYSSITTLIKVLQQSSFITSTDLTKYVLKNYSDLFNINTEHDKNLDPVSRQGISLEIQHVLEKLPNNYAVTDKADGERYFLIIIDNQVYLISQNLTVTNTGIILKDNKYHNTVLDGELVFIKKNNRYVFLVFDCLFDKGEDIRQNDKLLDRLNCADEIISEIFILGKQKGDKQPKFKGDNTIDNLISYYESSLKLYMTNLLHDIPIEPKYILVRRKCFMPVYGIQDNEIFKYSELMWKIFMLDSKFIPPYLLDGLVYQPVNHKYTASPKDTTLSDYKWKPENKNSIDFYITFERDEDTGKILILYDNSRDKLLANKPYKIANLHVGKTTKGVEQPVLFKKEEGKHQVYLFLQDGEARDLEGHIIMDETVVEFFYDNDPNKPFNTRWIPMRTRHDKTESVKKYGKKYGNYLETALKIWRSIEYPVVIGDIYTLSKDESYDKQMDIFRVKYNRIYSRYDKQKQKQDSNKQEIYYQKVTNLAKGLKNFHNWIKGNLIYTHCSNIYEGKKLKILDLSCGRGGDIPKFYECMVDLYVGTDIDGNGLLSADGAIARYNFYKSKKDNFPNMYFIQADSTVRLTYEEQNKALGGMTNKNRELIEQFFDKKKTKFDRINCQFAIHYFLGNNISWSNFLDNINNHLAPGGKLIITTFDADKIVELLGDKQSYASKYTTKTGDEKILFEIVKKYNDDDIKSNKYGLGNAIDVYNSLYSLEGVYNTEYLVHKDFLVKELLNRCNLQLVDSDLFSNIYEMNRDFIMKYSDYEYDNIKKKNISKIKNYYNLDDSVNKASYQMTKLNRYYIFRKND
jgi:SAM-dependent methyltransferase